VKITIAYSASLRMTVHFIVFTLSNQFIKNPNKQSRACHGVV
jgi:hypothetical protein